MAKSCFFIGHSEASDEIRPALVDAIQRHITEYGVTEFIVGGYGGFDRLVQSVLQEIKVTFPLTYHPAERSIIPPDPLLVIILLRVKTSPDALPLSVQIKRLWIKWTF